MNKKNMIINSQIINDSDVKINISSNTIRYGITIFEAPKIVKIGENFYLFRFNDYYNRLKKSCEILNIEFSYTEENLIKMIKDMVESTDWKETYGIRFNVFDMKESELLGKVDGNIIVSYLDTGKRNDYNMTSKCIKIANLIRTKNNLLYSLKSPSNYINARIELMNDSEYDDILYFNQDNEVCELSRSNIFFIKGDEVFTPDLECGLLDGITRKTIIDLCKENEIKLHLYGIKKDELEIFDTSFCVGTTNGIVPINRIGNLKKYEVNNPLAYKLANFYNNLFTKDSLVKNTKWFYKI